MVHAGAHLAGTPAEWRERLVRLLDDDAFHAAQVQGLRARVMAQASVQGMAAVWLQGVLADEAQPLGASSVLRG